MLGQLRTWLIALRNVLVGGNLASLSLITKPHEFVLYTSEALFLHRSLGRSRSLEQKAIFDVMPADDTTQITLVTKADIEHWFLPAPSYGVDIVSISLIAKVLKPKRVFEIGTLRGYTALHLALNSPNDAVVYTLDLPTDHGVVTGLPTTTADAQHIAAASFAGMQENETIEAWRKVIRLHGDSASFDFSPYFGSIDLFFIDGAHSYEYVRSDSINALKCCHPGSVILWHDYGRVGVNGVSKWLDRLGVKYKIYSVPGGSLAFMVVPDR